MTRPAISPSYALGLFFILLVTVIWSISSIVVQFLYTDENFDSPFILTYIGTALFIVFLPSRLLWERRRKICYSTSGDSQTDSEIIPWRDSDSYEHIPAAEGASANDSDFQDDPPTASPRAKTTLLSHRQHFMVALKIAPVWFISNYTYNASLKYTSITSSTVLASTGSLFTFLFAVTMRDEKFTCLKLLGVLLGVVGSALTGWSDVSHTTNDSGNNVTLVSPGHAGTGHHIIPSGDPFEGHAFFGDLLGLISAVGYGTYTVMIRVFCPHNEECYSMQLLLGYIGLVNGISLLPITLYILLSSATASTAQHLTLVVFLYLVAKGTFDNVISDYLWARAVILTSATVATVGLSLTIPLAFASDWFMGHANVANVRSVFGALSVLLGFTFVNVGFNAEGQPEEAEERSTIELGEEDVDNVRVYE